MHKNKFLAMGELHPSTAAHRLRIDLLFHFATRLGYRCFRCGEALTRESFSIEHKINWLGAEDPIETFFDIDNIAFSHLPCNMKHQRRPHTITDPDKRKTQALAKKRANSRKHYSTDARNSRFQRTGN